MPSCSHWTSRAGWPVTICRKRKSTTPGLMALRSPVPPGMALSGPVLPGLVLPDLVLPGLALPGLVASLASGCLP
ncbi:hypothetical protein ARTHROSP310_34750 [Arthrobacter sp. AD-310]